jgi:hypothetical protein
VHGAAAGRKLDRGGADVGGEVVPRREPAGVTDVTDNDGGDDGADGEEVGQPGARCRHRRAESSPGSLELGVEASQVIEVLERHGFASGLDRCGRVDPR